MNIESPIKISKNAPIALFIYKRPEHTRRVLEALVANRGFSESTLYVFADGARRSDEEEQVQATREAVRSFRLDNLVLKTNDKNLGLSKSIITGVTDLCNKYGQVIVLEDDLVVTPYFLDYLNRALELYADEDQVMQVSGHVFPADYVGKADCMFLSMTTSWGWATWHRAWQHFDATGRGYELLKKDRSLRRQFDLGGAYPYFRMMENDRTGKVDSWAIRWYLSVFMRGGLTLFPKRSLIRNIGLDGSGEHCGKSTEGSDIDLQEFLNRQVKSFPECVYPDWENYSLITTVIKNTTGFRKWFRFR